MSSRDRLPSELCSCAYDDLQHRPKKRQLELRQGIHDDQARQSSRDHAGWTVDQFEIHPSAQHGVHL